MKTGIRVSEAMTESPITVNADTTIMECANIMAEDHVGALLVKKDNKIVGIITEQDIFRKCVLKDCKPSSCKAEDIMETGLIRVNPEDDIRQAIDKMSGFNVRHLPVFKDETFLGLITTKDILKIEPHLYEILAKKIELKEEERKPITRVRENEGICESCGNYSPDLVQHEGTMVCHRCKEES